MRLWDNNTRLSLPDYFGVFAYLKGRTFIYVALILVGAVTLTSLLAVATDSWRDSNVKEKNRYLVAGQADTVGMFNFLMETHIGDMLAYGEVSTPADSCVKFDEMNQCFSYVSKHKELYLPHAETYECGTSDSPRTCTRIVWDWEAAGSETLKSEQLIFMDETIPRNLVAISTNRANAGSIIAEGDTRGSYYYVKSDQRYYYTFVPLTYTGTAFLHADGTLTKAGDFSLDKNIRQVIEGKLKNNPAPTIVFWMLTIVVLLVAGSGIFVIISNDITDGRDTEF